MRDGRDDILGGGRFGGRSPGGSPGRTAGRTAGRGQPASRIFDVEACGACNLECPFCPRALLPAEMRSMSEATFDAFLDRFSPDAHDLLVFAGIGEPFLNRRLPAFVARARRRSPKLHVRITTNGTFLDPDRLPPLLEAGLSTLDVSFNGLTRERYSALMAGADYDRVLENIAYARRAIEEFGGKTRLQVNFIVSSQDAARETAEAKRFWRARGVERFHIHRAHDRAGWVASDGPPGRAEGLVGLGGLSGSGGPNVSVGRGGLGGVDGLSAHHSGLGVDVRGCQIFDFMTFVSWRGDVHVCCHDIARKHVLGNVLDDDRASIEDAKASIRRTRHWPEICESCSDPLRHDLKKVVLGAMAGQLGHDVRDWVSRKIRRGLRRETGGCE